jgi:hypothetical protein
MTTITVETDRLNATQLARLCVTLRELGRNNDAIEVNEAGVANCGYSEFVKLCNAIITNAYRNKDDD